MKAKDKVKARIRRHWRIRKKINGSAERPRMCVQKSNKHLYVQFIDDNAGTTLASVSTLSKDAKNSTLDTATGLGKKAAETAKAKGIEKVVFDRGGFRYTGKVKAIAESAREAGLKI